jgi:hypothetical protein
MLVSLTLFFYEIDWFMRFGWANLLTFVFGANLKGICTSL